MKPHAFWIESAAFKFALQGEEMPLMEAADSYIAAFYPDEWIAALHASGHAVNLVKNVRVPQLRRGGR